MVIKIILVLLFISQSAFAVDKWEKIYKETKTSIPIIYSSGGICSGALIKKDLVLTAWHCIANLRSTFVVWDKDDKMPLPSRVVAIDKDVDLALVRLPVPMNFRLLKLVENNSKIAEGQEIVTIGHPLAAKKYGMDPDREKLTPVLSHIMSKGIISRVDKNVIVTDTSFSPGNSGGPVLNADGDIVGVVSRKQVGMSVGSIGYAVSPTRTQKFLKKYRTGLMKMPLAVQAQSHFNVSYQIGYHGFLDDFSKGDNKWFNDFTLAYDAFGRFRMFYSRSFEVNPNYYTYGLGWVFETPVKKDQVVNFVPTLGQLKYRGDLINQDAETFLGFSFHFPGSSFYMDYKWVFFKDDGESVFSFGFQIM